MHARYYNLNLGRFLSVDPVGGSVGSSQSWNRYAYVLNSPLNFVDPYGETVSFSGYSSEELEKVVADLNSFTGNTYAVDEGNLALVEVGVDSSQEATEFLNQLIGSDEVFNVVAVDEGRNYFDSGSLVTVIDPSTYDNVDYDLPSSPAVDPRTLNLGSALVHELYHHATGLVDTTTGMLLGPQPNNRDWTGPVVDFVNSIRAERNLPQRAAYRGRKPSPRSSAIIFYFNHLPSKKVGRRARVRRTN